LRRISPKKNKVVAKIRAGAQPNGVAYAFGAIWVADLAGGHVLKVDVRRNRVVSRFAVPKADWITPSADALWVSTEANEVVRLDPNTGAVLARIRVGANPLGSAWIGGDLWVPNIDDGTVSVIDPATSSVRTTLAVGQQPLSIAESGGDAWVSSSFDGELWRIHP
jgi:YVTN family beta-propeller protein